MALHKSFRLLLVPFLLTATAAVVAEESDRESAPEVPPGPEIPLVPVADEDLQAEADADANATAVPADDPEQLLLQEFEQFKQLFQDGVYDEADTVAKRVIELAFKSKGPKSPEMAKALTNLAIVQHKMRQYDAAQQNFTSAIEIIEDNEDRLNAQLVNPLKGLGAAQLDGGRPDLASDTYRRAIHVTHVNEGPHNLDQIELLESLAEVDLQLGKVDAAKDVQERIYALNVRAFDADTMELIPALMRRADWQHRAGLIYDERATYRRVIRIVEDRQGKDDLALIEPLILLGRSFFYIDTSGQQSFHDTAMASGEIYFKRAVRIAAENPQSNWKIVGDATLALGDYYMFDGNSQRANQVYAGAWQLLSDGNVDARLAMRHDELESVKLLQSRSLPRYVGETDPTIEPNPDDPVLQGKITVTFVVSTRGRATRLKLIESEPSDFPEMEKYVEREVRRRVYRPRFKDAEAVESRDQLFVHTYYYRQSDLDAQHDVAETEE
jgi:tetratricopeptide (TPR) repeat protein